MYRILRRYQSEINFNGVNAANHLWIHGGAKKSDNSGDYDLAVTQNAAEPSGIDVADPDSGWLDSGSLRGVDSCGVILTATKTVHTNAITFDGTPVKLVARSAYGSESWMIPAAFGAGSGWAGPYISSQNIITQGEWFRTAQTQGSFRTGMALNDVAALEADFHIGATNFSLGHMRRILLAIRTKSTNAVVSDEKFMVTVEFVGRRKGR